MKIISTLAALAGLALLPLAGNAAAQATVTYSEAQQFADMPFHQMERDELLERLSGHFDKLAKTLPQGQELQVEVLDVDLAGSIEPHARGLHFVRVLRGQADWPRMHLRYSIMQDGKVIKSGEDQLRDMSYLNRLNQYHPGESLRYEMRMLDDWFSKTVAAG